MTAPRIPRVIAGRWAITTELPLPFGHDDICSGFRSARAGIAECLKQRLLPPITVRIRLTWANGHATATVIGEDRELGRCASKALEVAAWPSQDAVTLDVLVTTREWDEFDPDDGEVFRSEDPSA